MIKHGKAAVTLVNRDDNVKRARESSTGSAGRRRRSDVSGCADPERLQAKQHRAQR